MYSIYSILFVSLVGFSAAVPYDYRDEIACARCAAFDDGPRSQCNWMHRVRFQYPGPGRNCYGGCIHIQGKVTDESSLTEDFKRQLTETLVATEGLRHDVPIGWVPPPGESTDRGMFIQGQLGGRKVIIKACASEVPVDFLGCQEVTVNGITGTVCKCYQYYCNKESTEVLKDRLDAETGQFKPKVNLYQLQEPFEQEATTEKPRFT